MEQRALDSEVTCGIPQSLQSTQQFTEDLTARVKQEVTENHCVQDPECFSETRNDYCGNLDVLLPKVENNDAQGCSANLNCGMQSSFIEDEEKGGLSTKMLTAMKVEKDQQGIEPWSVLPEAGIIKLPTEVKQEKQYSVKVEDHVVYKFESGLDKREAYDETRNDYCGNYNAVFTKPDSNNTGKCSASLDRGPHSTFNEEDDRGRISANLLTSMIKPVKNEEDQDRSEPWLVFSESQNTVVPTEAGQEEECKVEVGDYVLYSRRVEFYKCPHCYFATKHKHSLKQHVEHQHNPNVKLYRCILCAFVTKHALNLKKHLTVQHNSDYPVYRCAECSYATKWQRVLSAHIRILHSKSAELYRCPHCDYTAKYNCNITQHLKLQHDPCAKLYKCTVCDFETKHAFYLSKHVAVKHNSDAPVYQCTDCTFSTKWQRNLSTHIDVYHNSPAKLYTCPHCNYASKNKGHLTLHQSAACNFTTKHAVSLLSHVEAKHSLDAPVYRCAECEFTTKSKRYLTRHADEKHNPDPPALYKCVECDFTSKLESYLLRHVNIKHNSHAPAHQSAEATNEKCNIVYTADMLNCSTGNVAILPTRSNTS